MIPFRQVLIWAALQYGCLVASQDARESRVFLNATSTASSTISSTSRGFIGGPSHGPTKPTTAPVITVIGGYTATDGSYINSMGDTVTVTTSFSLSPVGVSIGVPTETETSLPWTGRILTDPGLQSSGTLYSSLISESSLASSETSSVASNSSSSKWTNTTLASPTSLGSSTSASTASPVLITPPGNISVIMSTANINLSSASTISSGSATYSLFQNVSTCSTLSPGEIVTIWSIMPNTTTTTVTITGNWSTSLKPLPEFTPPVYCPTTVAQPSSPTSSSWINTTSQAASSSLIPTIPLFIAPPRPTSQSTVTLTDSIGMSSTIYLPGYTSAALSWGRSTTTSITTSKNGVTLLTSVTLPSYGGGKTDKLTVDPSTVPPDSFAWSPQTEPSRSFEPTPITTIFAGDPAATTPITEVVEGVTVIADPSKAIIGSQTVDIGSTPQTVTESGQVFTVLPNEIDGPSVIISIPTYTSGGVFVEKPTPTTINGVSIGLGAGGGSSVVIGGTTFNVGPGAPEQTIVDQGSGQTITVGSGGVAFGSTTITPAPNPAAAAPTTNVAIVGASVITAVGSSAVIIDGQTITYGPNTPQTTTVFNGETITIGSTGVIFHGSTIGGTALNSASSQIGIVGGVSITEVGSTLAIISGTTFTIGPGATPTFATIASQIVSAGPDGFSDGSFTWNPFPSATQTLTAGSITFSELGSSLVVIGSKTYTFGPGASPTTDVYSGQTISIGPSGIGFKTTTFTSIPSATGTGTAAKTTSKKNGGADLRPVGGVLGVCILLGIGWLL